MSELETVLDMLAEHFEADQYSHERIGQWARARRTPDETGKAVEVWNETARANGLPVCQKITTPRRAKLKQRLKSCGGLDGWRTACERVGASPFCRGENDRGWRANIDFLLRESSFVKVMEGAFSYDTPKDNTQIDSDTMAALRAAAMEGDRRNGHADRDNGHCDRQIAGPLHAGPAAEDEGRDTESEIWRLC